MDWLYSLLVTDAPEGCDVESSQLGIRGLLPIWAALLIAALAAVGIAALYRLENARIGTARRVALGILRMASVGLLILMLLRPVLTVEFVGKRPGGTVLLLDDSLSMTRADPRVSVPDRLRPAIAAGLLPADKGLPGSVDALPANTPAAPTRVALVHAVLANKQIQLLEKLHALGPVRVFTFGPRAESIALETESAAAAESAEKLRTRIKDRLTATQTRTAAADAISEILSRSEQDRPASIVVFTDGLDNAASLGLDDAARECAKAKVPLRIYGVGSSEFGNLQMKQIAPEPTLFYDDIASVPVRWSCRGFAGRTGEIVVRVGAEIVARKDVTLAEGDDFREVITFTPKKPAGGASERDVEVSAEVRLKGAGGTGVGEAREPYPEDNSQSKPVKLVDRKVKLLYVESTARWDFQFLQTALLRDRRVEPRFVLTGADEKTRTAGPPFLPSFPADRAELFAYNVLVLGDVPSTYLGAERIEWIRDFVASGRSLILIAGRQSLPRTYKNTKLEELFPVEFEPVMYATDSDARPQPFAPELTRAGGRTEMLSLADTSEENLRVWQNLPGLTWMYPVTKLRAGARSLMVHPKVKVSGEPMPLLATMFHRSGLVMYLGTDETWRWRYNVADRHFVRFWGQVIYQMGLPSLLGNPPRIRISLDSTESLLDRPGNVYVRLFTSDFRPLVQDSVTARVERQDAPSGEARSREVVLRPVPGLPGEYRATLGNDKLGKFVVHVDRPVEGKLDYEVRLPPQHELEPAGMAETHLRRSAELSGGKFYREEDLHRLAADISPRFTEFHPRRDVLLWNLPMLILFVSLMTAEWILRKLSNLS